MTEFTKAWMIGARNTIYEAGPDTGYAEVISIAYKALDGIEHLQVDNTELKSLLLWALEHINIPFYLFDANDERNIWYNRVTEVTK